MREEQLQYYIQRIEHEKYDLLDQTVNINKLYLARVIDLVLFIITYALSQLILVQTVEGWYSVPLSLIFATMIYTTMFILFKGFSLGNLLTGINYISLITTNKINRREAMKMVTRFFRHILEPKAYNYESKHGQNIVLKRENIVLVRSKQFKQHKNDMKYFRSRLAHYEQKTKNTINSLVDE